MYLYNYININVCIFGKKKFLRETEYCRRSSSEKMEFQVEGIPSRDFCIIEILI